MQKLVKRISLVMVALMTVFTALSYMPAKAATVVPKVQFVGTQETEFTAGERITFNLNAANYGGRVQYRVVLWNDQTKSYSDLWNTADKYYTNWMPYGNETLPLGWVINEPGTYRITVYAKRAGLANSKTALKGMNCDSYLNGPAFVVKPAATTPESIAPVADVTVNEGETPVLPTEVTLNYANDVTKTAKVTWAAVDTTKVGTVAVEGTVEGTTLKAKVNVTVKAVDLAIKSVNVPNARQLVVLFNKAVDEDTATDVTNYAIKRAGVTAVALTSTAGVNHAYALLAEDGKTVTITLDNALTNGAWGLIVKGDTFLLQAADVKDLNAVEMKDQDVPALFAGDSVVPTFVSASAKAKTTTQSVTLTFSEPVDHTQAVVNVNGFVASLSTGSVAEKVVATISGTTLTAGQTYSVTILNIKDSSGNLIEPNPVTTTVTVTGDTVAPVVTEISVNRDNRIKVVFDKVMASGTITIGTVKLLDLNYNATGITATSITAADTAGKAFYLNLSAVPYNAANTFSGIVSVSDLITDSLGNKLAAPVSQGVTMTKDTAKPVVVSSKYVKVATYNTVPTPNGAIVVKFNESVTANASAVYTVVNNSGTAVSTPFGTPVLNPNDSTELVLPLSAPVVSTVTSYLVLVPAGAVTDRSLATNANAAANLIVDVSAGAVSASDTAAPTVTTITTAATLGANTRIIVTYNETGSGLDYATVVNTNNYRIDGTPLPAGSYVIVTGGNVATIYMPAGSIVKDKSYAFNVNGIKDVAGNVIDPVVANFGLLDDVKPVMTSVVINANGTLTIGFSETVAAVAGGANNDFLITMDGSPIAASSYVLTDGTGADAGKYVLSVSGVNFNNALTLRVQTVGSPSYVTDASTNANVLDGGTTIVVK